MKIRGPVLFVAAATLLFASFQLGLATNSAHAATTSSALTSGSSAVAQTKTITRQNLVNGLEQTVDSRTVTLKVSQTQDLRGRQEVRVTWSGAHPTGGVVADQNSIDAQQEEYPMVLLECRGVDSNSASSSHQLTPSTCWTQSWSERYQDSFSSLFPPYRLDQFASIADRAQVVGAPSPLPATCVNAVAPTQHWVPFIAASGQVYYGGAAGCAGQPPEANNVGGSALPSNETFGVTSLDGTGSANFDIFTSAENASLGCSVSVQCSLVAVPIMGIGCDASGALVPVADQPQYSEEAAAAAACQSTGNFQPGQLVQPQGQEALSVSGSLWWSASNWNNRISVPLTFAPPANACDVVGASNAIDIYGSELMVQATGQWAPYFCLNNKLFHFTHVQTGEPEARNLLATGSSQGAFTSYSEPGGYPKPVVNAPVALSGFSISYTIDGSNGQPYQKLRLTPRLLAKLLTESYPADLPVQNEDTALSRNPLNITLDPEFIKLNPGITQGVSATEAAAELVSISSDSDVIEALTTYINDNAQARAWLNGQPDPYGMVVNPAYRGITLPVSQWPLLSTFEPAKYYAADTNDCLFHSPVPYLPLVSAPLANLETVSQNLQFSIANSTTVCSQIDGTTLGEKLVAEGRQTSGYRFLIGITPLADTSRYLLNSAALQTTTGTFVIPSVASLRATAALLQPDPTSGTWPIPYSQIENSAAAASAYPGTMVIYAAVPTSGLTSQQAADFSDFLNFAATTGQQTGLGSGQLPPGYLPLTAANNLATLAQYTLVAASAVAAQKGLVPSVTGAPTTTTTLTPTTTTTVVVPTTTTTGVPTTTTTVVVPTTTTTVVVPTTTTTGVPTTTTTGVPTTTTTVITVTTTTVPRKVTVVHVYPARVSVKGTTVAVALGSEGVVVAGSMVVGVVLSFVVLTYFVLRRRSTK